MCIARCRGERRARVGSRALQRRLKKKEISNGATTALRHAIGFAQIGGIRVLQFCSLPACRLGGLFERECQERARIQPVCTTAESRLANPCCLLLSRAPRARDGHLSEVNFFGPRSAAARSRSVRDQRTRLPMRLLAKERAAGPSEHRRESRAATSEGSWAALYLRT